MTINIEKKHLVIGTIAIFAIIVGAMGISALKNSTYNKNAKCCQKNIHKLYFMSSLLSSEIHDTWRNYIFDDKEYIDRNTGRFYKTRYNMPSGADEKWCSSFSVAIEEKSNYKEKGVISTLDSLYSVTKSLLTTMTPAPKKHDNLHREISEFFHTAEAMYNCAVSPEGNLQSYTEAINSHSSAYKKQSSNLDIQIGEIDEDIKSEFELDAVLKFL